MIVLLLSILGATTTHYATQVTYTRDWMAYTENSVTYICTGAHTLFSWSNGAAIRADRCVPNVIFANGFE